jgi:shikimate dehydrogenase
MSPPLAAIVGWPATYSRSPVIHKFWLKELGLAGDYGIRPVRPEEAAAFFASFAASGLVGANVTVPLKEAALASVARPEPAALAIGAVNTVWLDGRELRGDNTDAYGFLANLDQNAPGWDMHGGPAVVLGAGGAAKAVVSALVGRRFRPVTVVNRTMSRAANLGTRFGSAVIAAGTDALPGALAEARLLVNTTSLGMAGEPPLAIDLRPLPNHALVTDLVYVPLETPLLLAAKRRGLRTVDGLGMLLHQAAPAFARFFGTMPKVTPALRAAVIATLVAG